jgi:peptide chain release factor 2
VDPRDVKMDVFRSMGAGGQNVNKTSTAVRLTHLPTGIVVTCQNERSQVQNREVAMRILQARLLERQLAEREREQAQLKGAHIDAEWGNQIRSYVLHPYSMVKDHRTGYETGNVQAVLDGDLDAFMEAYLHHNAELVPA